MARSKLKEAQDALTDEEREKLRAVVPLTSVEAFVEAMRAPVSDREIARVWDRVSEQITRQGGSIHAPLGSPVSALPMPAAPTGYTFTGAQIAGSLAGVFVAGVLGLVVLAGRLRALAQELREAHQAHDEQTGAQLGEVGASSKGCGSTYIRSALRSKH